jgi:hypothetical protein
MGVFRCIFTLSVRKKKKNNNIKLQLLVKKKNNDVQYNRQLPHNAAYNTIRYRVVNACIPYFISTRFPSLFAANECTYMTWKVYFNKPFFFFKSSDDPPNH